MTKLLQQCFLLFIVVVIPGHNLGNSQVSVNRTIGLVLISVKNKECGYSLESPYEIVLKSTFYVLNNIR